MTLNIPYSFTPGTKAKAQEVNANFIYVLEQIEHGASNDFSDLSEEAEKHFINKSQISNCILEAHSGVATYSAGTVTLKTGLKILVPNGRNNDGTLNNIEYTFTEDKSSVLNSNAGCKYLFADITSDENIVKLHNGEYIISNSKPNTKTETIWFNPEENVFYQSDSNGTNYQKVRLVYLGSCIGANGTVTSLNALCPVSMAKEQDIDGFWTISQKYFIKSGQLTKGEIKTFDLSSYLPKDNNLYEIIIKAFAFTGSTNGSDGRLLAFTDFLTDQYSIDLCGAITRGNGYVSMEGNGLALVGDKRILNLCNKGNATVTGLYFVASAYRKVR